MNSKIIENYFEFFDKLIPSKLILIELNKL